MSSGTTRLEKWKTRFFSVPTLFLLSAIITWPILAEYEVFEEFYEFSRDHEDWDLDELALLVINLVMALTLSIIHQSFKLRKTMAARDQERQRAEKNARHDPLTGLMNRRAFNDAIEELSSNGNGSDNRFIAMIDLDRFKPVNDLYGHAAGDAVLQEVAERFLAEVGTDALIARLGGDEISIIFRPGQSAQAVERSARRLLKAVEEPIEHHTARICISCSIGLVKWDADIPNTEIMRRADKALYMSKTQGRGRFAWYDPELDRQSHERAEIEAELREAIVNANIEPWYQPIVEIDTHKLTGFEVLARWNHKTRGQIPPGEFIEIAEDSGQISSLGAALLRRACLEACDWDPELSLSFNISPLQFHDRNLVEQIQTILADTGFDPHRLTIEITESSVIQDFEVARTKLDALKELGVAVALDDFGTGYSSLASLRHLPFDRIKIDRGFVTNIMAEPQNQKIVSGIMALAKGLELGVTAEGIETTDDLGFLKNLHCPLGQGFLFEKAVPAKQVAWLLETSWSGRQIGGQPDDTTTVDVEPERKQA